MPASGQVEQVSVRFQADIAQYTQNLKRAQDLLKRFGLDASNEADNTNAGIGRMVAGYLGLGAAINAVRKTISTGMGFNKFVETSTASFGVMMKSMDAAKNKMTELFNYAVKSPLTFRDTVQASRQLMAYGFTAKELIPTMDMLGTVAKAVGVSLGDMAYVYGTLRSQGRAYTRDLMQFAMRGIPIYEELSKVMGVSVGQMQKMTEEGKVGFKEVEQAFINMTTGSGKFAGFFEEFMKTLEGKMSMLSDLAEQAAGRLTKGLFEVVKRGVGDFTNILRDNGPVIDSMSKDLAVYAEILLKLSKIAIALLPIFMKLIPLMLFNKALSGTIGIMKAMPEILMLIGLQAERAGAALLSFVNFGKVGNGVAGVQLMIGAFKQFGATLVSVLPTLLSIAGVVSAIAAGVAIVATVKTQSDAMVAKLQTDPAYATKMLSAQTKGINYTKMFDLKGQMNAVAQLQKMYSSLSQVEIAKILLQNKAISEEAYKQIEAAQIMKKIEDLRSEGLHDYGPAKDPYWYRFAQEKTGLALESTGVNKENYNIYSIVDALTDYQTQVEKSEIATDSFYKAIKREVPEKDMIAIYNKELDKYQALITSMLEDPSFMEIVNKEGSEASQYFNGVIQQAQKIFDLMIRLKNLQEWKPVDNDAIKLTEQMIDDLNTIFDNMLNGVKEFWRKNRIEAAIAFGSGDNLEGMRKTALNAISESEVGKFTAGANPLAMIAQSLTEFFTSIENVNKVLNPFKTILESAKILLEPLINSALRPAVILLEQFGQVVGKIVAPFISLIQILMSINYIINSLVLVPLQILGAAFAWFNDSIIVPVGNFIIDIINGVIRAINKALGWLGVHIQTLDKLLTTAEANMLKLNLSKATDALSATINYLSSKLNDLIDTQLNSLKDLYNVGAISGAQYQSQVATLNTQRVDWEKQLVSISDQQLTSLQAIHDRLVELYTLQDTLKQEGLTDAQKVLLLAAAGFLSNQSTIASAQKTAASEKVISDLTNLKSLESTNVIADLKLQNLINAITANGMTDEQLQMYQSIFSNAQALANFVAGLNMSNLGSMGPIHLPGLASGTSQLSKDTVIQAHKGEGVIPQNFMDAIRNGELSLSGPQGISGGNIYINVEGSVVTQRELIEDIDIGLKKLRKAGHVV